MEIDLSFIDKYNENQKDIILKILTKKNITAEQIIEELKATGEDFRETIEAYKNFLPITFIRITK